MSNFTDLVPPLELCRMIPAGEFEDSYAAYFGDANGANITLDKRVGDAIWKDVVIAPAPTLQEIMTELPASNIYRIKQTWTANFINDSVVNGIKSRSATTAALKLWLKLKGIEDGK